MLLRQTRNQSRSRRAAADVIAGALAWAVTITLASLNASAAEVRLGPASLSVMGQQSLTFRSQAVSGTAASRSSYRFENYSLARGFEHRTDLLVNGMLLPGLRVDAAIARGPYGPSRQRLTFTFEGSDAVVKAGDLAVAFDGDLMGFSRSLRGLQVDSKIARGALTVVASESKPSVRADLLYGRNSAGPYYLAASPVVDASEVVEVDGRRMKRGADYSIDYQIGLLQFAPALIIPPTSRIAVRYEYEAPGAASGSLIGLRGSYPISSALRVGATYLTVERRGAAAHAAVKEDRWLGNNSAGPFTLTSRPIELGSERVRLDGILQVAGVDYSIEYATGSIVFLQPVPAGVSIIVSYRVPATTQSGAPNRSLVGLDAHLATGKHFNLDAEIAQSIGAAGAAKSGAALALGARGDWDWLSFTANLRSSSAAFAPFESAATEQIRSGYDCQLALQPLSGLRISAAMRDHRRAYLQYGDASDLMVRDRSRQMSVDFNRPGLPTLSYLGSWSTLGSGGALNERSGNHLLTLGYERQSYGLSATYRRNSHARQGELPTSPYGGVGYGLSPENPLDFASSYAGSSDGTALSMWYRPGARLNIVCDLASNGISVVGGGKTRAGSSRFAVDYMPSADTSVSIGYRASSSGDTTGGDGQRVPGYSSSSQTVALRHSLMRTLSLNLTWDSQMSRGGYSTNSDTKAWTAGFWWQPAQTLSLIGQYGRQNLAYLGATGRSTNAISSLGATVGPFGPGLKLDVGYSHMGGNTSGSFGSYGSTYTASETASALYQEDYGAVSNHGMANSSLRARLTYPVADRQEAFAEWETSSNSGYPGGNRRQALALGWQIGLTRELNFVVDWRQIASKSADTRYSYRARTFGAELGLKF